MASTLTVTVIPDNKGTTAARVMGNEYCVDFYVNITNYKTADYAEVLASQIGLASITAVFLTGVSATARTAGMDASHISANMGSGANAGKYITTQDIATADRVLIMVPASGNDENVGELRFRAFGYI